MNPKVSADTIVKDICHKLRCKFSRFSPVIDLRFSYKGHDVVETLERICQQIGYPKTIHVDQGSEFISP